MMSRIFGVLGLLLGTVLVENVLQAAPPPVRILPLGDSITYGCCISIQGGYRARLYQVLTAAGYNVDFVGTVKDTSVSGSVNCCSVPNPDLPDPDSEGHGGYQIHEINAGLEGWLGSVEDPDVVLLLIGTNDYTVNNDTAHAINRLENLIAHIATARPYAKIIVANLLLRADNAAIEQQIQSTFNSLVPGVVNNQVALGRQVSFVDLHSSCGPADFTDGLHPNQTGYSKIADRWYPAITSVISPLGTANPPAIVSAAGELNLRQITVKFSKPLEDAAANPGYFSVNGGVSVLGASLDAATKRIITLTTSPQAAATTYTLTVNGVRDRTDQHHLIAAGSTANFVSGPISEAASYNLVYSLNLPNQANFNSTGVPYQVDNRATAGAFSRIAYYLEMQANGGAAKWVWVSMNAFTTDVNKIGVPSVQSGSFFHQPVSSMNVRSSVPGIATGTGLPSGYVEFWAGNYGPNNDGNVPFASSSVYDWGDGSSQDNPAGYGSMQIQNSAARQTVFAFNGWGMGGNWSCDLGIGNNSGQHPDWTFAASAPGCTVKKLQVYVMSGSVPIGRVLTVNSSNPNSGASVTVSPVDSTGQGNGLTGFTRSYSHGTTVTLTAASTASGNVFQKWQKNGVDAGTSPTIQVVMDASYTLTAVYGVGPLAPRNVPEAANYTLVYSLNLPNAANYNSSGVPYEVNNRSSVGAFSRVGYYLELQTGTGPAQWVWVSMNAFTTDPGKIGVPVAQSGALFRQAVASLNVRSSVAGVVTGDGLTGGYVEFWPSNYSESNGANVPGASSSLFDWGDTPGTGAGYGSMQVHNTAAGQTILAFNAWGMGNNWNSDLGIGNYSGPNPDWTFAKNGATYIFKKLQVYVLPAAGTLSLRATAAAASFSKATFDSTGGFALEIRALPGHDYQLDRSTDAVHWEILTTFAPGDDGTFRFTDRNPLLKTHQFYRLVPVPVATQDLSAELR